MTKQAVVACFLILSIAMHSNFLRLLALLLTLVMTPVEAFASIAENIDRSNSLSGRLASAHLKLTNHFAGESQTNQDSASFPVSQSYQRHDAAAILHAHRWSVAQREDSPQNSDPLFFSGLDQPNIHGNLFHLCGRLRQLELLRAYHFSSNHRLAGWKETNAMYVALNSQFS
ncbi:hypothetical protein ATY36_19130 [Vibrio cidicii]|jgi:hypothetical protein|nr:hypothetical protein ATY36_19130 [Vibrio cidicii]